MVGWLKKLKARFRPSRRAKEVQRAAAGSRAAGARAASSKSADPRVQGDVLAFPSWPPPNPREMLSRRTFYKDRTRIRKHRAPQGVSEDAPLYALYRLYECFLLQDSIDMCNELEFFWWTGWPVSSIPDPGEQGDPERYAVLACIPALLVASFNERIEKGQRRGGTHAAADAAATATEVEPPTTTTTTAAAAGRLEAEPAWTERVPPLETVLHIPHSQPDRPQLTSLDDPAASPEFRRKNILAVKPYIHFS